MINVIIILEWMMGMEINEMLKFYNEYLNRIDDLWRSL